MDPAAPLGGGGGSMVGGGGGGLPHPNEEYFWTVGGTGYGVIDFSGFNTHIFIDFFQAELWDVLKSGQKV